MGQFKFTECDIEGMFIVEPAVFGDNRGYFMETFTVEGAGVTLAPVTLDAVL